VVPGGAAVEEGAVETGGEAFGASVPPVTTVFAVVEVTLVEVAGAVVETGTLVAIKVARVGAGGTVRAGLVSPAVAALPAGTVEATSETAVVT
jgi:hypothetical protein